jgi:carbonic anhydrase
MNNLDLMLKRNKESAAPMPSLPQSLQTLKAVIIGCADMRVDPAQGVRSARTNRRGCQNDSGRRR